MKKNERIVHPDDENYFDVPANANSRIHWFMTKRETYTSHRSWSWTHSGGFGGGFCLRKAPWTKVPWAPRCSHWQHELMEKIERHQIQQCVLTHKIVTTKFHFDKRKSNKIQNTTNCKRNKMGHHTRDFHFLVCLGCKRCSQMCKVLHCPRLSAC